MFSYYLSITILKSVFQNGALTAIPYAACWAMQNISSICADYLRSHGYISTGNTRKLFNTLGKATYTQPLIVVSQVKTMFMVTHSTVTHILHFIRCPTVIGKMILTAHRTISIIYFLYMSLVMY